MSNTTETTVKIPIMSNIEFPKRSGEEMQSDRKKKRRSDVEINKMWQQQQCDHKERSQKKGIQEQFQQLVFDQQQQLEQLVSDQFQEANKINTLYFITIKRLVSRI